MKGPDKKKKKCSSAYFSNINAAFYSWFSLYVMKELGMGTEKGPAQITLHPAVRWHGSVTWRSSAACPSRTRGTSIILQLMKSEFFCRTHNFSASLLLSVKGENTVWCGYFLPSPLFILNPCEGGNHPVHST